MKGAQGPKSVKVCSLFPTLQVQRTTLGIVWPLPRTKNFDLQSKVLNATVG